MLRLKNIIFAVATATLLAFAPAAMATDGVVLINQNTAITNNGLPGCPTNNSFPVIICKSGSYKLSTNLNVPSGAAAIQITADNVTLDLNGFTITASSGVLSNNSNLTVRNGQLAISTPDATPPNLCAAGCGLYLLGTKETVLHVTVSGGSSNSEYGIDIGSGIVRDCAVSGFKSGVSVSYEGGLVTGNYVTSAAVGIEALDIVSVTNNLLVGNQHGVDFERLPVGGGYGLNTFVHNGTDVFGGVSMHNNVCSNGTTC